MISANKSMRKHQKNIINDRIIQNEFKDKIYQLIIKSNTSRHNGCGNRDNHIGWEYEKIRRIMTVENIKSKYKNDFYGDLKKIEGIEGKYNNYEILEIYTNFDDKAVYRIFEIYKEWFQEEFEYKKMLKKMRDISDNYPRILMNHIKEDYLNFIEKERLVNDLNLKRTNIHLNKGELEINPYDDLLDLLLNNEKKRGIQILFTDYKENKRFGFWGNFNYYDDFDCENYTGCNWKLILSIDSIRFKEQIKKIIVKWFDNSIGIKEMRNYINYESKKIGNRNKRRKSTIKTKKEKKTLKYRKRKTCR